jgi:hypothetical protein
LGYLAFPRTGRTNLINIAKHNLFDNLVLQYLANDTTITTAYDQNLLRVGMGSKRKMRDHLLIAILL